MPKTYKKVAGVWQPIKKIFVKVAGSWLEAKKVYKKITGSWVVVHISPVEYSFTNSITASTSQGILLSSYVNPNSGDVFNIIINSGVTLSGKNGTNGINGINGSIDYNSNCHSGQYGNGTNGSVGDIGGYCLNLTGFNGKIVNIINNGTIKGGNGGNGGNGGAPASVYIDLCSGSEIALNITNITSWGGCGAAGGAGGNWLNNPALSVVNFTGNVPFTGNVGDTGLHGSPVNSVSTLKDTCHDSCAGWNDGCCGCNAE